jgi:hypothetical protein
MPVIKPLVVHTKMSINNKRVIKVVYPSNGIKRYSKNQIKKLVKKYQEKIKGDYEMMVSVNIPNRGFRSGRSFNNNEHIEFPNDAQYDFETTPQFVLYYYKN